MTRMALSLSREPTLPTESGEQTKCREAAVDVVGFFSLLTQLRQPQHSLYQSVPEPSRDLPHGGGQPGDARGGMRVVGDAEAEPAVCASFPRKEGAILADGEAVPMAARCGPPAKLCRARASVAFATPSPTSRCHGVRMSASLVSLRLCHEGAAC